MIQDRSTMIVNRSGRVLILPSRDEMRNRKGAGKPEKAKIHTQKSKLANKGVVTR